MGHPGTHLRRVCVGIDSVGFSLKFSGVKELIEISQ